MTSLGIDFLDLGINYIRQGLMWIRDTLTNVAGYLPLDANLAVTIVFLAVSLWLGNIIAKKFVTKPMSFPYLLWTIVISISIFLNLMYF